jgi:mannosyltransferase OCH1-like enzyme
MFRYRLLMLRGGWWVDTDVVCLSPQVPDDALFLEREDDTTIGNAVMKFPQGHAFVGALYEASRAAGQDIAFGQTGPALITKLAQQQGMWDRAGAPSSAYPVHYDDAFLPVTVSGREATRERTRSAAFLHLWNEVFRRAGSMALHNPPNRSFLADLYRKHRVHRRFWSVIDRHKVLTIRHAVRVRLRDAVGGR